MIQIARPVQYNELINKIKQYYGRELRMYYTSYNNDVSMLISGTSAGDGHSKDDDDDDDDHILHLFFNADNYW